MRLSFTRLETFALAFGLLLVGVFLGFAVLDYYPSVAAHVTERMPSDHVAGAVGVAVILGFGIPLSRWLGSLDAVLAETTATLEDDDEEEDDEFEDDEDEDFDDEDFDDDEDEEEEDEEEEDEEEEDDLEASLRQYRQPTIH